MSDGIDYNYSVKNEIKLIKNHIKKVVNYKLNNIKSTRKFFCHRTRQTLQYCFMDF